MDKIDLILDVLDSLSSGVDFVSSADTKTPQLSYAHRAAALSKLLTIQ